MLALIPPHLVRQTSHKKRLFLTADEHYFHRKICLYCDRPWENELEMNDALVAGFNQTVRPEDQTIHVGDFCFGKKDQFIEIIRRLNGHHFLMDGSHDSPLEEYFYSQEKPQDVEEKLTILPKLFEFTYNGHKISLCHYAMARFWCSHYDGIHFFGHSHGHFTNPERALDIGIDCHSFLPVSIESAIESALTKNPPSPRTKTKRKKIQDC